MASNVPCGLACCSHLPKDCMHLCLFRRCCRPVFSFSAPNMDAKALQSALVPFGGERPEKPRPELQEGPASLRSVDKSTGPCWYLHPPALSQHTRGLPSLPSSRLDLSLPLSWLGDSAHGLTAGRVCTTVIPAYR